MVLTIDSLDHRQGNGIHLWFVSREQFYEQEVKKCPTALLKREMEKYVRYGDALEKRLLSLRVKLQVE